MAAEHKTAEEIRQWVHAKVHQLREIIDNKAEVGVPAPVAHQADENGANWDMHAFGNAHGYTQSIRDIVEDARKRYRLLEPE